MQDLRLWSLLRQTPPATATDLVPLLKELAGLPVRYRLLFYGDFEKLLLHPDPDVRAAAVGALAEAIGQPAWPLIVRALNDPDPLVCRAALQALWYSAGFDAGRWAHAYFHSDEKVRRQARSMEAPNTFGSLFPYGYFDGKENPNYPVATTYVPMDEVPQPERDRVRSIVNVGVLAPDDQRVLDDFIHRGTGVDLDARATVADYLARNGNAETVLPVLMQTYSPELIYLTHEQLQVAAQGLPFAASIDDEQRFRNTLNSRSFVDEDQVWLHRLVTQSTDIETRYWARDRMLSGTPEQSLMLSRLTRAFAWGVEMCQYLTGQRYKMEMLVSDYELGYTRLRENKLYITPLPILRGERGGVQVVRGLILHEIGHHLYHRGPEADAVWQQADDEGLGRLLNLVADEHLERNLRHRSPRFGNLLKILNAYAFQHTMREVQVSSLLGHLGDRADEVLTNVRLLAARKWGHVAMSCGRILREMEEAGMSFARFMRALRMGLGNRTGDPKVAEALALFRGKFRRSTMPELLVIARKLREIFGQETNMLNDFGMERVMTGSEDEWLAAGPGLDQTAVQQGVDSLLSEQEDKEKKRAARGPGRSLGLNMGAAEDFKPINKIEKLTHVPASHAPYARQVARAARLLRQYFKDLGLGLKPQRGRMQGRHFDRTRTRDMILKGDPRFLISRSMDRNTDLFLGVVIDCSGSMAGESMEKARLFGTLLAEALNGQPGVDLRLFGFTDRVIYDAGTARRCAVHALFAHDGNNDSAALWHVYHVAKASKRKAKLLVMISDGLPTECTVASLKGLVARLTRWRYCCAQVAVLPLDQICFPHYVLLQDRELSLAVRRFGEVIMRLVKQALGLN